MKTYEVLWSDGGREYGCERCEKGDCPCILDAFTDAREMAKRQRSTVTVWVRGRYAGGASGLPRAGYGGLRMTALKHKAAKARREAGVSS